MLLIVAIAAGVGVLVFRLTGGVAPPPPHPSPGEQARGTDRPDTGLEAQPALFPDEPPGAPEGYIRVETSPTSWSARLGGAMGLVIAIGIGAITLALSVWGLISLVARIMSEATPPSG
jgi:hypothetical protein